jgi:hypothetical protein
MPRCEKAAGICQQLQSGDRKLHCYLLAVLIIIIITMPLSSFSFPPSWRMTLRALPAITMIAWRCVAGLAIRTGTVVERPTTRTMAGGTLALVMIGRTCVAALAVDCTHRAVVEGYGTPACCLMAGRTLDLIVPGRTGMARLAIRSSGYGMVKCHWQPRIRAVAGRALRLVMIGWASAFMTAQAVSGIKLRVIETG